MSKRVWYATITILAFSLVGLVVVFWVLPVGPRPVTQTTTITVPPKPTPTPTPSPSPTHWRDSKDWTVIPPPYRFPPLYAGLPRDDYAFPEALGNLTFDPKWATINVWLGSVHYNDENDTIPLKLDVDRSKYTLDDTFNDYAEEWRDPHYVGNLTCGHTQLTGRFECIAHSEDATIVATAGGSLRNNDEALVEIMNEYISHLQNR
ncbi:hypothetical protein [Tessaracoccus sp. OH4464_COT-324]|uniref:hypothetical protein n=1 Tax=Tessaracoccus sp. OH4464_COT-324 TaxID=2491059 RepID=UPI000F62E640|nr:hypothetical protein [Tessaracoccus sp. OH4464_COT-324]RRD44016.1 hypothetical protein EII42_12010 [Tessaracoccus sp. OH4464_COT-324]